MQLRKATTAVSELFQHPEEFCAKTFDAKISKLNIPQMQLLIEHVKTIHGAEFKHLNQAKIAYIAESTYDFAHELFRHAVAGALWNSLFTMSASSSLNGQLLWGSATHQSGNWINLGTLAKPLRCYTRKLSACKVYNDAAQDLLKIGNKMNESILKMGESKWGCCICIKCAPNQRR